MSSEDPDLMTGCADAWPVLGASNCKRDFRKVLKDAKKPEKSEKPRKPEVPEKPKKTENPCMRNDTLKGSSIPASSKEDPSNNTISETSTRLELNNEFSNLEVTSEAVVNVRVDRVEDPDEKKQLRKERHKMKKEARKQEKALQREEEIRKKRLAPKDQKVTIIDRSVLERLQVKDTPPLQTPPAVMTSINNKSEFPSLGEIITSAGRSQKRNDNKRERSKEKVTHQNLGLETANVQNNSMQKGENLTFGSTTAYVELLQKERHFNNNRNVEDIPKITKNIEENSSGKRPKRRDPIQLDINEILKVQVTKAGNNVKHKHIHKSEVVRYSGNILDSDNPQRKRGKQREVPKPKKPSSLKQIILHDRMKRKESHQNSFKTVVLKNDTGITVSEETESIDGTAIGHELKANSDDNTCETIKESDEEQNNLHKEDSEDSKNENDTVRVLEERLCTVVAENEYCEGNETKKDAVIVTDEQANKFNQSKPHSRKFRDYCDHYIVPEILKSTTSLLEDIVKFHDGQYARSPLKASAKRRHVTGLKEVRRFLALRRMRLLVIAPDLEFSGGLDEIVNQLKESAIVNGVPYVFALGRRQLGYILKKKVPVSCVGILNYEGTEHNFHNLMSAVEKARDLYKERVALVSPVLTSAAAEESPVCEEEPLIEDVNKEVVATLLAKLTETKDKHKPMFLEAIERCTDVEANNVALKVEE